MSRVNKSYYAILGILSTGEMSGYQIKSCIDVGVGYFWDVDYKQIYPTLKKLVAEGLATFETVKSGNRPESKVYKLTDQGVNNFKEWLVKPVIEGKQSTQELLLKLYFGHNVSVDINLAHLERFKKLTLASLQEMNGLMDWLEHDPNKDTYWHYRMTTVNKGYTQYKAELDWCNDTIEFLKENAK